MIMIITVITIMIIVILKVTEFRCPSTGLKAQCAEPPCPCPVGPMDRNMMYENRMLGVPRMRQIRVTETSCLGDMNQDFSSAIRKCYSPYGLRDEDEDKADYIPEHRYTNTIFKELNNGMPTIPSVKFFPRPILPDGPSL